PRRSARCRPAGRSLPPPLPAPCAAPGSALPAGRPPCPPPSPSPCAPPEDEAPKLGHAGRISGVKNAREVTFSGLLNSVSYRLNIKPPADDRPPPPRP